MAAVSELTAAIVGKYDTLFAIVTEDARLRVGNFAAAGQLQEQKAAGALEDDAAE